MVRDDTRPSGGLHGPFENPAKASWYRRQVSSGLSRGQSRRLLNSIKPQLTDGDYESLREWTAQKFMKPTFLKVFGQTLDHATNQINQADRVVDRILHDPLPTGPKMTNKTGFGSFKSVFGDGLGSLKKMADEIGQEMQAVVSEGQRVQKIGRELTDQAKLEIAEAREALAQFRGDNGAPE